MLISKHLAAPDCPATDTLWLTYEERLKSRGRLMLPGGEEFGYSLPPGTFLQDGDKLLAEAGDIRRVVAIAAKAEELVRVRVDGALHFARAAYHLGNRHVKVEIGGDGQGLFIRLQPDHVLEEMLRQLGCGLTRIKAPFQPETGAYGGHGHHHDGLGHDHGDGPDTHAPGTSVPKIHTFR